MENGWMVVVCFGICWTWSCGRNIGLEGYELYILNGLEMTTCSIFWWVGGKKNHRNQSTNKYHHLVT